MINLINKRKALELAKKKKMKVVLEWGHVGSFYTIVARNIEESDYREISQEIEREKKRIESKRKRLQERKKYIEEVFSL